ncbi:Por secretion system C-terminal sorting domain-containing protein, partial [Moheibacter sediminis]
NEVVKSVQVYDLNGKLILNQTSNSISNVNLNTLPKGTYVVKATTDKQVNTFKIVKN